MNTLPLDDRRVRRPVFRFPIRATVMSAICVLLGLATVELTGWWVMRRWITTGEIEHFLRNDAAPQVRLIWLLTVLVYALARAQMCHPGLKPKYAAWLTTTPWRPGRPLPGGPPFLVWEDLIPAAAVAAFCPDLLTALTIFTASYALVAALVSPYVRDSEWFVTGIATAAAGQLLFWPAPIPVAIVDFAGLVAADIVVRRSLHAMPWSHAVDRDAREKRKSLKLAKWPMEPLAPPAPIWARQGWTYAGLLAWAVFCVVQKASEYGRESRDDAELVAMMMIMLTPLARWAFYCARYQPPITTWGRIRTLRLIIPGYDYVLVAPLAAWLLGAGVPFLCWLAGAPRPLVAASGVFAVFAVVFNAGPTLARWQLTGAHRIMLPRRVGKTAE